MTTHYYVTIMSQRRDTLGQRKRATFVSTEPASDGVIHKAVADHLRPYGLDPVSDYIVSQIVRL